MERYEYIKCNWNYIDDETPVILFYEVDLENERYARRMIEVFSNGRISLEVDEINQDEDFLAQVITKEEFEKTYQLHEYFENLGFSKR